MLLANSNSTQTSHIGLSLIADKNSGVSFFGARTPSISSIVGLGFFSTIFCSHIVVYVKPPTTNFSTGIPDSVT